MKRIFGKKKQRIKELERALKYRTENSIPDKVKIARMEWKLEDVSLCAFVPSSLSELKTDDYKLVSAVRNWLSEKPVPEENQVLIETNRFYCIYEKLEPGVIHFY